nr:hypothetical protein Iba_chr05cCG7620 [Ipomoea batatas]
MALAKVVPGRFSGRETNPSMNDSMSEEERFWMWPAKWRLDLNELMKSTSTLRSFFKLSLPPAMLFQEGAYGVGLMGLEIANGLSKNWPSHAAAGKIVCACLISFHKQVL